MKSVLWDASRHLLVERSEHADLTGTLDLPAMGMNGIPVTGTLDANVRLLP